jgi:hypothetical protein
VSHLKTVERWRDDVAAKIARVGPETEYGKELGRTLEMYEQLLSQMREAREPKQKSLPMREMGDETE